MDVISEAVAEIAEAEASDLVVAVAMEDLVEVPVVSVEVAVLEVVAGDVAEAKEAIPRILT